MKTRLILDPELGVRSPFRKVDGSLVDFEDINGIDLKLEKEIMLLRILILDGFNYKDDNDYTNYWEPYILNFKKIVDKSCIEKLDKLGYEVITYD